MNIMATATKTARPSGGKKTKKPASKDRLITNYMNAVLENGETPKSIFKFSKENGFSEAEFYAHFGSFEALRNEIWNQFYQKSIALMEKSKDVATYSSREKMLTFFFTFFEMLTANRSYVLFTLKEHSEPLKNLGQMKGLRKNIKGFAKDLIKADNETQNKKFLKRNETIFSEGAWAQTLFLLKFWMDDNSAKFEKTDIAIEKSVNTIFDVFDNTPLERIFDFGKFLWKEKMV